MQLQQQSKDSLNSQDANQLKQNKVTFETGDQPVAVGKARKRCSNNINPTNRTQNNKFKRSMMQNGKNQ